MSDTTPLPIHRMDLDAMYWSLICYITFSIIVIGIDLPLFLMIYTHRHLRKQKELVVMGYLCFADFVQGVTYFTAGTVRMHIIQTGHVYDEFTNKPCVWFGFPILFLFSYHCVGSATLAISFDRLLAVMFPFRYRKLTYRYAYIMVTVIMLYNTTVSILVEVHVHTSPALPSSILCMVTEAYVPFISHYMLGFRCSTLSLSILLYVPIMIKLFKSSASIQSKTDTITKEIYSKQMMQTTKTVGSASLAGFILIVIPDLIVNLNILGLNRYEIVWYTVQILKCLLNIFLFTTKHDELRRVIRSVILSKTGEVFSTIAGSTRSRAVTIVTTTSRRVTEKV